MKSCAVFLSLFMLALSANATSRSPSDVEKFIAKREGCDHMRGEIPDPGDVRRMKEVNRQLDALCKGSDKALAKLKRKYAHSPDIMSRLREFEPSIEGGSKGGSRP